MTILFPKKDLLLKKKKVNEEGAMKYAKNIDKELEKA